MSGLDLLLSNQDVISAEAEIQLSQRGRLR